MFLCLQWHVTLKVFSFVCACVWFYILYCKDLESCFSEYLLLQLHLDCPIVSHALTHNMININIASYHTFHTCLHINISLPQRHECLYHIFTHILCVCVIVCISFLQVSFHYHVKNNVSYSRLHVNILLQAPATQISQMWFTQFYF